MVGIYVIGISAIINFYNIITYIIVFATIWQKKWHYHIRIIPDNSIITTITVDIVVIINITY